MTNRRVLAVSDNSTENKQVKRGATSAVWSAKQAVDGDSGSAGTYVSSQQRSVSTWPCEAGRCCRQVALFKLTGAPGPVSVSLAELGLSKVASVLDCWSGKSVAVTGTTVSRRLSPCSTKSEGPCAALLLLGA